MEAVEQGALIEVEIEKAVFRGLGLARHQGQVVLVRGAYPGERWRVRVSESKRHLLHATREQALKTIGGRREPPCPWFPECGGCAHQDLEYAEQLSLKRAVLLDALARARVPCPSEIDVIGSPETAWRTRASLHVQLRHDGVHLGLTAAGSHQVVDFESCGQLSERANAVVRALRRALQEQRDLAAQTQRMVLAESRDGSKCVVAVEGAAGARELARFTHVAAGIPGLDGLGALTPASGRQRYVPLAGETHVASVVNGVELRSHVAAFFQGNRFLLDRLVGSVESGIPEGGCVLDLYGGVGLFSLPLARRAESVVCVEVDRFAVEDARANAQRAGLSNVRVVRSDVRRVLVSEPPSVDERIVIDPPRTGLGVGVVEEVARRRPRAIVYVSCDPPTLSRDLARFAALGYRAVGMTALDLFPNTFHIETVAHLERA